MAWLLLWGVISSSVSRTWFSRYNVLVSILRAGPYYYIIQGIIWYLKWYDDFYNILQVLSLILFERILLIRLLNKSNNNQTLIEDSIQLNLFYNLMVHQCNLYKTRGSLSYFIGWAGTCGKNCRQILWV